MHIFPEISTKGKLIFLTIVAIFSLSFIGILSISKLSEVNKGLESVYNDRIIPLEQLKRISDMYAIQIVDTLHKTNAKIFSLEECLSNLTKAQSTISQEWKSYLSTFLTQEEKLLVDELAQTMHTGNLITDKIFNACKSNDYAMINHIAHNELYPAIDPIGNNIAALINLQLQEAKKQKNLISEIAINNKILIWLVLIVTLWCVLWLSIRISKHIVQTQLQLQATLEAIPDPVIELDSHGNCYKYYSNDDSNFNFLNGVVGCNINDIFPNDASKKLHIAIQAVSKNRPFISKEFVIEDQVSPSWFEFSIAKKDSFMKEDMHFIVLLRNITQRKRDEKELTRLAHYDQLTNLSNRFFIQYQVKNLIDTHTSNEKPFYFALFFVDLDQFKNINDSWGHLVGDKLLIETAQRISNLVSKNDFTCRQGGDEFILIVHYHNIETVHSLAKALLDDLAKPYVINTCEVVVTSSIGIALYPEDGQDFITLLRCADSAMYNAKKEGRNTYSFFTQKIRMQAMRKIQIENALRFAIENNEFEVYYQPQIDIKTRKIVGAEALLRWHNEELGTVSPVEFIPIAESSGLIIPIGLWVIEHTLEQVKRWDENSILLPRIAINLSILQFRHPKLLTMITTLLDKIQLSADTVEFELTESVAMEDPIQAMEIINGFREYGFHISIDDFGTGYSSLSYLKQFNVSKLKIDRSFIKDVVKDSEDQMIVSAVIGIAKNLGITTLAEGVETEEQLTFLEQHGCEQVQGYYFSKPLPTLEFEKFVSKSKLLF